METTPANDPAIRGIPARSRQQAMDWSLVLASQGIEPVIQQTVEGGWVLVVRAPEAERALKSLRYYLAENRGWNWRQPLRLSRIHFHWGCLAWAAVGILFYAWSAADPTVRARGVMSSDGVLRGRWWELFTAMLLHADVAHLATNLTFGIILLGLVMARFGAGLGLLAAFFAGAGGNVASLWFNTRPFNGLGMSGMVMGALGLLAAQAFERDVWHGPRRRALLGGLAAGVMLFSLLGTAPGTDIAAHAGGFVSGMAIGAGLVFLPEKIYRSRAWNIAALAVLGGLIAVSWNLALRK